MGEADAVRILTDEQNTVLIAAQGGASVRLVAFPCASPGDPATRCPSAAWAIPEDCWATILPGGDLAALGDALPWLRTLPEGDAVPWSPAEEPAP